MEDQEYRAPRRAMDDEPQDKPQEPQEQ